MICHLTMPKGWKPSIEESIQKPNFNSGGKCPNCHISTMEGWIFCNSCGMKLDVQTIDKYTMAKVAEGFDTYDVSNVMKIQYPKDWMVIERKLNSNLPAGMHVQFQPSVSSLLESSSATSLSIMSVKSAEMDTVLAQFPIEVVLRLSLKGFAKSENDPSYTLEESCASTMGGNPAYKIVEHNNNEKYLKIWTVKHNELWIIGYVATIESYPSYLVTVEKMIDSISFKDNG